jgi:hypothetical protein
MYLMDNNPDAVFEIANYSDEKYLMVIHESKLDFKNAIASSEGSLLDKYVNTLSDGYKDAFSATVNNFEISFNNYNARKIELEGKSGELDIIWHTIAIESDLHLFQICYWTLKGDLIDKKIKELLKTNNIDTILCTGNLNNNETFN